MIKIEQIQQKLAEEIKLSGLRQTEIASLLNISPTQICSYIKGRKMPSLEALANLCAILKLDANEILCVNDYYKSN